MVTSPTVLKLIVFSIGAAGLSGLKEATAAASSADVAGASGVVVLKLIVFSTGSASFFGLNDAAAATKSADGPAGSFLVTLVGVGVVDDGVSVLKEIVLVTSAAG